MPVYTVHAPVTNGADFTATDKFAFVRDGFHFWAAVAGVVWLAWHRLWLSLLGWIVLMAAIDTTPYWTKGARAATYPAQLRSTNR